MNNQEKQRLQDGIWKKWGPYLSERQWGTVREDYSAGGDAWGYTTHEMARSKAWRWGEEGLAGICDDQQILCFAISLWNGKDPILKERLFGLSGPEGNHGEDVKEIYYYLDSTPTHSYMRMLYKYPQAPFPYDQLLKENAQRTRNDPEFEILDTGIFEEDAYFDVFVEYAKADKEDILIRITVKNRGNSEAALHVLPTLWFRNTWDWGYDDYKPNLYAVADDVIEIQHRALGNFKLFSQQNQSLFFCENETNNPRLYNHQENNRFYKDGINDFVVNGMAAINPDRGGTKAAVNYELLLPGQGEAVLKLRLNGQDRQDPFADFDQLFSQRMQEADLFYSDIQNNIKDAEERSVQRQAFAGMLWNKQFYYYDIEQWLKGDPAYPPPPPERLKGRNSNWKHLNNANIISMPDKWEYPWYAAWDLGFHCITLSLIDPALAKKQLLLLTKDWYMHPSGQLPAYEWSFGDTNPPVHAWAAWRVYELDWQQTGKKDFEFLETVFHRLIINFTWWVNRKDALGNNIFEGGFLGMDNVSLLDRNRKLPKGVHLEQSDGTSWMAMYSLNLMRIALELAKTNESYQDMATKFFEHFLYIAGAMENMGEDNKGLWDEQDEFYYDMLKLPDDETLKIRIRSMVGLIPLFAVEVLEDELLQSQPKFVERMKWFLDHRPDLSSLISRWHEKGSNEMHLLSLLRGHRMKRILYRMLDETEFLSDYGVRALSKYHLDHPFHIEVGGENLGLQYCPGESNIPLFGGNSNWRGPVWMPVNYLIIESLQRFHHYYGDEFIVEYPTGSGKYLTLEKIAQELGKRLIRLFLKDGNGNRPIYGEREKFQKDPAFNQYVQFFEYFHGDLGWGLGASHQTGWTGLITKLIQPRNINP